MNTPGVASSKKQVPHNKGDLKVMQYLYNRKVEGGGSYSTSNILQRLDGTVILLTKTQKSMKLFSSHISHSVSHLSSILHSLQHRNHCIPIHSHYCSFAVIDAISNDDTCWCIPLEPGCKLNDIGIGWIYLARKKKFLRQSF